jgi:O-antigen/teichoic acid export membrane protein
MRSQKAARNLATTILAQLITWSLAFAVTIYLPNYLGPSKLGQLAMAGSIAGIAGVFVALGVTTVLVKEIARDHSRTGELVVSALLLRIPTGIIALVISFGAVRFLSFALAGRHGFTPQESILVAIYCCVVIVATISNVLAAGLQGQERMARQNLASVVEKVVSSGVAIAFVILRKPLWMFAGVGLVSGLASVLVNATAYTSFFKTFRWPKVETLRWLTKAGLPFMGVSVFTMLYGQTDPLVLGIVADDKSAGMYTVAFRLIMTTLFLPSAVNVVILPILSRLHHEGSEDEFRRVARRAFSLVMLCGIPIGLTLMVMPGTVMDIMPFKAKFPDSVPVLGVGGAGVILWFAAGLMGQMVIARDEQKKLVRSSMSACILGVPLCFFFSYFAQKHWHNGAVGAITSDVVLETFLIGMYLAILPKGMFDRSTFVTIVKCTISSIPMALSLYYMTHHGVGLWALVPCAIIYAAMCFVLQCIGPDEIALVRSAFKRKSQ